MAEIIVLGFGAWMIVGLVVVEACRLWRVWYLPSPDLFASLLWPLVLVLALKNGPDQ